MTFQITPDECNRLIRSYQHDAGNRPRVLTGDAEEKELLEAWRARIQALAQHAAFLRSGGAVRAPLTKKMVIEMYEPTGYAVRVCTEDKPKSLFQRGISARVLQGVKLCDKCMRQLPQCVCHQSNPKG